MLETAHQAIKRSAKRLGLSKEELEYLLQPDAEHVFDVTLSGGKIHQAYRVQHNGARGPYKGGIRFHPEVSLEEVRALATLMSIKTAIAGIPLGGGKGGVTVNPKELTEKELKELAKRYAAHLSSHIGPEKDVPGPDVGTSATVMDWMADEFSAQTGDKTRASFTGKSLEKGGSLGREASTGRGGVIALREILKRLKKDSGTITYAVQGFGNVGSFFAAIGADEHPHWRLVAATDTSGGPYNPDGLNARHVVTHKLTSPLKDFSADDVKIISNEDALKLDVDVLVMAALGDAIDEKNMHDVQADIILELANGPVHETAYNYLTEKGVVIIPDVLANAGGVIVSYLEWIQNREVKQWPEAKVNAELEKYMVRAIEDAYKYASEKKLSLKDATFDIALKRILTALKTKE